jgi:hypothetical protein
MVYGNPYIATPYMQQAVVPPVAPPVTQQEPQQPAVQRQQSVRVSGREEAMSRFLMMYPAYMLVPGFISEALFDVNGRQFHTLSIEADNSRNLETFDYKPHVEPAKPQDYVTHAELEALLTKLMGENDGIHEPVPAAEQDAAATA